MKQFIMMIFVAIVIVTGYHLLNGGINFAFDMRVHVNNAYSQLDDADANHSMVKRIEYWGD